MLHKQLETPAEGVAEPQQTTQEASSQAFESIPTPQQGDVTAASPKAGISLKNSWNRPLRVFQSLSGQNPTAVCTS